MTTVPIDLIVYPLRFVRVSGEQYFYLSDAGKLLGLKNPRTSVRGYGSTEILTAKKLGVNVYHKYADEYRRDNSILLLTKFGLMRFIFCSNSAQIEKFKDYFNNLVVLAAKDMVPGIDVTDGNNSDTDDALHAGHVAVAAESREIMEQQSEYIYIIVESPYQTRVKIGKTKDIARRLTSLQTGNPNPLQLYAIKLYPVSENIEAVLHAKWADRRISGEWFWFEWSELAGILP